MDVGLSLAEENYLKAMYHLSGGGSESVNNNALAESIKTSPASTNDMVKRLSGKKLLAHQKYRGTTLLPKGKKVALSIIRKHRLWEVFLVEKLQLKWDEVHEIAEQLEHVKSPLLISRLDEFLGRPTVDPHGDAIPDEYGNMKQTLKATLSNVAIDTRGIIVSVSNDNPALLKHLNKIGIELGSKVKVTDQIDFDGSIAISINGGNPQFISKPIADSLMITILK